MLIMLVFKRITDMQLAYCKSKIKLLKFNMQAMMKDQFGNYVVQKVLETCDEHSREIILSRIKVHLNALKRYTYGKHIVSRVEKLVTAGGEKSYLFYKNASLHSYNRYYQITHFRS